MEIKLKNERFIIFGKNLNIMNISIINILNMEMRLMIILLFHHILAIWFFVGVKIINVIGRGNQQ